MNNLKINEHRLWRHLTELGNIGRDERGVSRVAFTEADMEGRKWFLHKMEQAGLETRMDEVGNVFGITPYESKRRILVGSHMDTVPEGGMFDGALGVVAALECAQTLIERNVKMGYGLEIVGFSNEEGAIFGPGLLGSRYFVEGIGDDEIQVLEPILKRAGLEGFSDSSTGGKFDKDNYVCYLELHVEQGGVLYCNEDDIGVVQGIVAIYSSDIVFEGKPNHAGTTPMDQREDALLGAANMIVLIPKLVAQNGSKGTVGTCGQIRVYPCARNVIPGRAELSVEIRDLDDEVADRVMRETYSHAETIADACRLRVHSGEVSISPPALMDTEIQQIIHNSAVDLGLKVRLMPSGAGHDAAIFAKYLPTGMIFVPSKDGVSHSPEEWTNPQDCANGANVLLKTILKIDRV